MVIPGRSDRIGRVDRARGGARLLLVSFGIVLLAAPPVSAALGNARCSLGVGGFADTGPIEFLGAGEVDGVPVSWIAPPPFSIISQLNAFGATQHAASMLEVATTVVPAPGDPALALSGACSTGADLQAGTLRLLAASEQVDLTSGVGAEPFATTLPAGFAELAENFDLRVPQDYAGPIEVTLTMTLDGSLDDPARDGWTTGVRVRLQLSNVEDGTAFGTTLVSNEEIEASVTDRTVTLTAPIRGLVCGALPYCETYFGLYVAVELYGRHPELGDRPFVGSGTQLDFHPVQIALASPEGVTLLRGLDGGTYDWVNPVPEPASGLSVLGTAGFGAAFARRRVLSIRARREATVSRSSRP